MLRLLSRSAALVALVLLVGVYGCDAGHGFVKDDFVWILTSRVQHAADLWRLLGAPTGFFRPIVSLSFAIDHGLFGLSPLGYGLSNLALLLACVGMLLLLFRAIGLRTGVAIAAALVWAFNFQSVNMAVLWISGRTALIVTFWAVAAAYGWVRGHRVAAALLTLAAMFSKEEGFVLPAVLTIWALVDAWQTGNPTRERLRQVVRRTWMLWIVLIAGLIVRERAGAYTPSSAPAFYQYQFDLATLAGNIYQYADRAATTPVLALLVFWLSAGRPYLAGARPNDCIYKGLAWLVLGFAPTVLLPVRSSLYALLPSVGVVMVLGDLADRMVARAPPHARERATALMLVLLIALVPVYRLRNQRYVKEAELSAAIVNEISKLAATRPDGGLVVIKDVRDVRPTAEQSFGTLAGQMTALVTAGRFRVWIDPPPAELAGVAPPAESPVATLVVEQGTVRRAP